MNGLESYVIEWLMQQGPVVVVLVAIAWDLRKNLIACIEHNQDILETLLDLTITNGNGQR